MTNKGFVPGLLKNTIREMRISMKNVESGECIRRNDQNRRF